MIVYGKHRKKYVLSAMPVSQDYDGAVYQVPANPDVRVKIYQSEYRTAEKEREVIDTINGTRSMMDEFPVDVVYANGRFAGYLSECAAEPVPLPEPEAAPLPAPRVSGVDMLIGVAIIAAGGLILSLLLYFLIFDLLRNLCSESVMFWNFKGIPMIVIGWIAMVLAFLQFRHGNPKVGAVVGLGAYLLGAALTFGAIALLVFLLTVTVEVIKYVLPLVIFLGLLYYIFKAVLKH